MKKILLAAFVFINMGITVFAQDGIHWITLDEAQAKMAEKPKKVIVDVYTSWCGWCKKMDAGTYTNPALVKYINNNYYAVKFNAEQQETVHFQGKEYKFEPQYKANAWAVEMMKGQMGYPTTIFLMENFQNPTPIGGYHPVKEMEMFLLFFGDNVFRHRTLQDYQKTFVSAWENGEKPEVTPQMPPSIH